jgi:hypothetical protein
MRDPSATAPALRRPFTRLGTAGLAGHVFYELAAGVGMPLASVIGPVPAAGLWATASAAALRAAGRRPSTNGGPWVGLMNGMGLASVLSHYTAWPSRRTRLGTPWLIECEGMGPDLMPAYNATLYVTAVGAVGGLVRESRGGRRAGLLLAAAAPPLLIAAQHWEFRRLQEQARQRPAWWNRQLQRRTGSG